MINADVLDAWFSPAPAVLECLSLAPSWMARTSPPTHSEGLLQELSARLGVPKDQILAGAGSSALMYLALGYWLTSDSRMLLLEPTYGEYAHYGEHVAGCQVDRIVLSPDNEFKLDIEGWVQKLNTTHYDLAVLVNPNNPTGQTIAPDSLEDALGRVPKRTRVLIDEAYIDYVGGESMASFAACGTNVFVLKSLSKSLALSGLRVAYLVGAASQIAPLRLQTPPWAVSLPAQVAAVKALGEVAYYDAKYLETAQLRASLAHELKALGFERQSGTANWLLLEQPNGFRSGRDLVATLSAQGLFVRDAGATAESLSPRWIRIAVKDAQTQTRMLAILKSAISTDALE